MCNPIRVVLVGSRSRVRSNLRALVAGVADAEVVGEAADPAEAMRLAELHAPVVVVLDPGEDALRVIERIAAAGFQLLVLLHPRQDRMLLPLLNSGASGYVTLPVKPAVLGEALRTLSAGEVFLDEKARKVVLGALRLRWHQAQGVTVVAGQGARRGGAKRRD